MANQEHLDLLKQGVHNWNQWRIEHPKIFPDLTETDLGRINLQGVDFRKARLRRIRFFKGTLLGADLRGADLAGAYLDEAFLAGAKLYGADLRGASLKSATLHGAHLRGTNFDKASLEKANFSEADLSSAKLRGADLWRASFSGANLSKADLSEAHLSGADLMGTNLMGANLTRADLSLTTLVQTNLAQATLKECNVYGMSVWDVKLEDTVQKDLIITPSNERAITVDNLKVAQFIYLLLNNTEIRDVIDTIAKKAVLILGRFTPERKVVLDALREALRTHGYLPILFDFEKPSSRNFTETVRTLAHLSRFVIADLTDPSSIPQELQAIVPTLAVPVQPILIEGKREYAMFVDLLKTYHWVLSVHYYSDQANLLATLKEYVIEPAEQKAYELEKR